MINNIFTSIKDRKTLFYLWCITLLLLVGLIMRAQTAPYSTMQPTKLFTSQIHETESITPEQHIADLSHFSTIIEKPLFHADRKPFANYKVPPEPEQHTNQSPTSHFTLQGTIITADTKIALVNVLDGKREKLTIGDQINRWQVLDIQPHEIIVSDADRQWTIELPKLPTSTAPNPTVSSIPPKLPTPIE